MTAKVRPLPLRLRRELLAPGVRWHELAPDDPSAPPRRLIIAAPEGIETLGPRPLVVFLHGGGGGKNLMNRITCLVQPGLAKLAPIIVAPEAGHGEWWQEDPTSYVLGLTEAAARDWPVQANHIVIMGYSNGGIGTWFFSRLYPEGFSAAIPMASNHTIIGESPLPIFAIHGSRDDLFDVGQVKASVSKLTERGLDVRLEVHPGGVHGEPCSYKKELEMAAAWLERDVWSRAQPAAPLASESP